MMTQFLSLMLATSVVASAAQEFSVSTWKAEFARSVRLGETAKTQELSQWGNLEKKALPACIDCKSKSKMHEARILFEKSQFKAALKLYNSIPKVSDHWLEAVEERGWAHFRNENYEKAIAQTKTLLSPQFAKVVNSEAFFLQSLSQLRICDYEGVLKTHQVFKEKQKERISAMQTLANTGTNEALRLSIEKLDKFPLSFVSFGENLATLPLLFYRDLEVQRHILRIKVSQAGLEALKYENGQSLKAKFQRALNESSNSLKARMKVLAAEETKKNAKIIQKLNLVEIEAIQRIHTDMKLTEEMYNENDFKDVSDDQLMFVDDGQPWIDELDKYDVVAKSCAKNIRRKM